MGDVLAQFFVEGRARTKGHLQPRPVRDGRGRMKITNHDRPELKAWLVELIKGIREQAGITVVRDGRKVVGVEAPWPYVGPVVVDCDFYFQREQGWESHDTPYPTARDIGDVDTLTRAVLDALTMAGVLEDDRWVVEIRARKRWIDHPSAKTGVLCVVRLA